MPKMTSSNDGPRLTPLGRAFVFLFIVACIAGAFYLFMGKNSLQGARSAAAALISRGSQVKIGIAYGPEKQHWLEWAASEFAKTSDGNRIKISLMPMSSPEADRALLSGDQRIDVWSPSSAAYKDVFVQDWTLKYNENPIIREEPLARTPMVFVVWDERYQPFIRKYHTMSFDTINQALEARSGWEDIAQRPEWGLFKFGQTHPVRTSSGLTAIALAAYEYQHKTKDLTLTDVLDPAFEKWLESLERAASGMSNSTETLMEEMLLKGPSAYDVLFVDERIAIASLQNGQPRWGKLRVVYPEYDMWNDNPYYILNAPWSAPDQRKAADVFLNFLLTEPVQKKALTYGYRPANQNVPLKFEGSPFVQYADNGLQLGLQKVCEQPKADVISNLVASWQRTQGVR